ncbi:hypothetical protein HSBAA_61190 [Vreelandella sulfidaeris]|uniref:Uncharacterized protein n=1 Tax=Vreelandella sulfidaeris TaxID=115553 RepID=A0A455UHD8_9GAMM|nr:hypothetical protein HSBAA_61190 [Halomonas sulfidaeris]
MERVSTIEEDVATGPRTWKISDILDDYASLKGGKGFGYITDALFSIEGIMQAIIINPSNVENGKGGPRAYPFMVIAKAGALVTLTIYFPYSREGMPKSYRF